jgi:hypothetical protein
MSSPPGACMARLGPRQSSCVEFASPVIAQSQSGSLYNSPRTRRPAQRRCLRSSPMCYPCRQSPSTSRDTKSLHLESICQAGCRLPICFPRRLSGLAGALLGRRGTNQSLLFPCAQSQSTVWEVLSGREDREVSVVEHESQILLC